MSLPTILLIALGLAMDCFAVAVASGFTAARMRLPHALRMALFFGLFQAIMPILGWFGGTAMRSVITGVDHWIAFGLLAAIGVKMIYESRKLEEEREIDPTKLTVVAALAVATSIDALAVGIGISFLGIAIVQPAVIIGAVSFVVTLAGVYLGKRFGHIFENKLELLGGLILIAIGAKILVQHLTEG